MATEILYDLIKRYIDPILAFNGYYISAEGQIINSSNNVAMKFQNPHYTGAIGESELIIPTVPCSDEHYMLIKNNPETEIFNPFVNRPHMLALLVQMRPALVPYYISKEKLSKAVSDEDYDKLTDYIRVFNSVDEQGMVVIGFSNNENPENTVDICKYTADDTIKAAWGLCVTTYNSLNGKHPAEFDDVDKSWKKIQTELAKWDKARKGIVQEVKVENESLFNVTHTELTDEETTKADFCPASFNDSDYIMNDDTSEKSKYLTSLFDPASLEPFTDSSKDEYTTISTTPAPAPAISIQSANNKLFSTNTGKIEKPRKNKLKADAMAIAGITEIEPPSHKDSNYSTKQIEPAKESKVVQEQKENVLELNSNNGFSFNPTGGNTNPYMRMGIWGGINNCISPVYGKQVARDVNDADLTGGDIVNPFQAYM